MDSSDPDTHAPGKAGARSSLRARLRYRLRDNPRLVPNAAVITVVVTALLATFMVTRSERLANGSEPALSQAAPDPAAANELGAGPACGNCGVVETVAADNRLGVYRMLIRMDNGTVRTVEHRDALAAGSRVLVDGGTVRLIPAVPRQG